MAVQMPRETSAALENDLLEPKMMRFHPRIGLRSELRARGAKFGDTKPTRWVNFGPRSAIDVQHWCSELPWKSPASRNDQVFLFGSQISSPHDPHIAWLSYPILPDFGCFCLKLAAP